MAWSPTRIIGGAVAAWLFLSAAGCSSTARFSSAKTPTDREYGVSVSGKKNRVESRYPAPAPVREPSAAAEPEDSPPAVETPVRHAAISQTGVASYYARKFHGRRTASGERYDMHELTAAHPRLPFGTRVRVTNLGNNRSVVVRVNDRGPHTKKRVIDLSYAAAKKIGLIGPGTARVRIEAVE